jgi:hypothetical protein
MANITSRTGEDADDGPPVRLFAAVTACLAVVLAALYSIAGGAANGPLAVFGLKVSIGVSLAGFAATYATVPSLREKFISARLFGIDLNKATTRREKDGSLWRDPLTNGIEGIKVGGHVGGGGVCEQVDRTSRVKQARAFMFPAAAVRQHGALLATHGGYGRGDS